MIYKNVISSEEHFTNPGKVNDWVVGKVLECLMSPTVSRLFHLIKCRLKTIAWLLPLRPRDTFTGLVSIALCL